MRDRKLPGPLVTSSFVLLFGCTGEPVDEIARVAEQWELSRAPILSIGEEGGGGDATTFFRISAALRDSLGRIIVADASSRIRVFERSRGLSSQIHASGEGPGEFQSIDWMGHWRGDSLAVYDGELVRLTILDTDGRLGRTMSLPAVPGMDARQYVGVVDDSVLVVRGSPRPPVARLETARGVRRFAASFAKVSADGAFLSRAVGRIYGSQVYQASLPSGFMVQTPLPLAYQLVIVTGGGNTWIGYSGEDVITRLGATAEDSASLSLNSPPVPTTPAVFELAIRAVAGLGERPPPPELLRLLEQAPVNEHLPYFGRAVVTREGDLWLAEYSLLERDSVAWRVYDGSTLQHRATIQLPRQFNPTEIASDTVLGVWQGALGVETIKAHVVIR